MPFARSFLPRLNPNKLVRRSRIRLGKNIRFEGIPAILVGVALVVAARGAVAVLEKAMPFLPDSLREARELVKSLSGRRPELPPGQMISDDAMRELIRHALPDAEVDIIDLTGTMDHFNVLVRSNAFAGISLMDRHRLVERSVAGARADGRIHALSIRTELLE